MGVHIETFKYYGHFGWKNFKYFVFRLDLKRTIKILLTVHPSIPFRNGNVIE